MDSNEQVSSDQRPTFVILKSILLFASFCSIGFPLLVSVLLLGSQGVGYRFPLALLILLGPLVLLLLGIQRGYLGNTAQYTIISRANAAFSKFRWLLWVLITTAVFLGSNHLLVRGLAVGIWDADGAYYPYQALVADYARAGRFLHWDPWASGGLPLSGDPQVGAFSPLNLIVGVLTGGTSRGFIAYWLLMWWLGGFGIIMLARQLKAPSWGGCMVASGFLVCGAYTANAQHTALIGAFSYLPLIIWRLEVSLSSQKLWPSVEAGALWGLSALSGYPGLTIITGCFCGLWAIGRWLLPESSGALGSSDRSDWPTEPIGRPKIKFVLFAVALVLFVGFTVLSPTYFAFLFEGTGTHIRAGSLNRDVAVYDNSLDPGALSTFASPYLATLKANDQLYGLNRLWPYTDLSMCSIYSGVTVFVFALLAILRQSRDRFRWWLAALGALSLACALGRAMPLRGWLYDWFYPMQFFRHAAIFRYYYLFIVCVLALLATRDIAVALVQKSDRIWRYFTAAAVLSSIFALVVFLKISTSVEQTEPNNYLNLNRALGTWLVVSGPWLGICGVAYIGSITLGRVRTWCLPALLLVVAASDAFLTSSISQVMMISTDPPAIRRWQQLDESHSSTIDLTNSGLLREESSCSIGPGFQDSPDTMPSCKSNDQYITKIPVFDSYTDMKNSFHITMTQNTILKKMATGTDRIWFSKDICQVAPTERFFSAFVGRTEALGAPPLVIHMPEALLNQSDVDEGDENTTNEVAAGIQALPASEPIPVDLIRYEPDELCFNVRCPADGWLLVTDRWARSWRVEINGNQSIVYGGNFIFRAIQVSAGPNIVRFSYSPRGFPWLLIMSWGTLAMVFITSLFTSNVRPKKLKSVVTMVANGSCRSGGVR